MDVQTQIIDSAGLKTREPFDTLFPIKKDTLAAISDYKEIQAEVMSIAAAHGVPFFDFNGPASPDGFDYLHDDRLFYDYHHLNTAGVAAFNPVFLMLMQDGEWL